MSQVFQFSTAVRLPVVLFGALAITLLVVPGMIHWLFGMEGGTSANIMSRRAGCLFAGLATVCALAAQGWRMERIVSAGIVAAMGALAVLGFVEYLRGAVGLGIWLAIITEVILVALFVPHITR